MSFRSCLGRVNLSNTSYRCTVMPCLERVSDVICWVDRQFSSYWGVYRFSLCPRTLSNFGGTPQETLPCCLSRVEHPPSQPVYWDSVPSNSSNIGSNQVFNKVYMFNLDKPNKQFTFIVDLTELTITKILILLGQQDWSISISKTPISLILLPVWKEINVLFSE